MKIFKNKIFQYSVLILLFVVVWSISRVYPQSSIQLKNIEYQQHEIIVTLLSPKDFGTRGYFEINSRLICIEDENNDFRSKTYVPTQQEFIGLIEKEPAKFDRQQHLYIYHISLDLNEQQRQDIPNKKLQCRVMTGHYLRGFIRSNVIKLNLGE